MSDSTFAPIPNNELLGPEKLNLMLHSDSRLPIVLSDFDGTLCHDYEPIPNSIDREPLIGDDVILAAKGLWLVVATARRLNHPKVLVPWDTGLVDRGSPLILENGGILARHAAKGIQHTSLVSSQGIKAVHEFSEILKRTIKPSAGTELIVKNGITMALALLRDQNGKPLSEQHSELAEEIRLLVDTDEVDVVHSGDSVVMQVPGVTKATGFEAVLDDLGIDRDELCVVGMGDSENDIPIFEIADISISFGHKVANHTDINVTGDAATSAQVLNIIRGSR